MSADGIVVLDAAEAISRIDELAALLSDVVNGNGGVGFMAPFPPAAAEPHWRDWITSAGRGERVILAALCDGAIAGSVQLVPAPQPNQPHRADVAKLLVLRRARRRGIARSLMERLEAEARALGRTLLTLDTETGGAAEALYCSMGYRVAGIIPDFALRSLGGLTGTTILYKQLASPL